MMNDFETGVVDRCFIMLMLARNCVYVNPVTFMLTNMSLRSIIIFRLSSNYIYAPHLKQEMRNTMTELTRRAKLILRITDWAETKSVAFRTVITLGLFAVVLGIGALAVLTIPESPMKQWLLIVSVQVAAVPSCGLAGLIWYQRPNSY